MQAVSAWWGLVALSGLRGAAPRKPGPRLSSWRVERILQKTYCIQRMPPARQGRPFATLDVRAGRGNAPATRFE